MEYCFSVCIMFLLLLLLFSLFYFLLVIVDWPQIHNPPIFASWMMTLHLAFHIQKISFLSFFCFLWSSFFFILLCWLKINNPFCGKFSQCFWNVQLFKFWGVQLFIFIFMNSSFFLIYKDSINLKVWSKSWRFIRWVHGEHPVHQWAFSLID